MKIKILIIGLCLTIFGSSAIAQAKDFRSFTWGTSFAQVRAKETAKLDTIIKDDMLIYKDQLASADCDVIYTFNDNDKLVGGRYSFTKAYSDPDLYLNDYYKFKNLLTQKYGNPSKGVENWSNATIQKEQTNYGQAIADGYLTLSNIWTVNNSTIKISITQSDSHPVIQIDYISNAWNAMESKEELAKALQKL